MSVFPEHFLVDPQKQECDTHVSESPVQSSLLSHSIIRQFWKVNKHGVYFERPFFGLVTMKTQ